MTILSMLQEHGLKETKDMLKKAWWKKERVGHMKVQSIQKRIGHMKVQYFKKKAHVQRKRGEIVHERSSYTFHTILCTHTHLDQGLWLVSPKDPVFDLATYKEQVRLQLFPNPELHISLSRGRWKRKQQFALVRNSKSKMRDPREQTEELGYVWFRKFTKPKWLS